MSPTKPVSDALSRRTALTYGLGSVAYGVKDNGFQAFLLIFYNQVIGLPAATVGLAVMVALLLDAFIDPLIGLASDHTRSRWGRRHPWMYASALPIALGWIALWNPPNGASVNGTIVWLFVAAVLVRSAVSAYEVPSSALTPELSADYDDRTRLAAWRYLFGWAGGLTMLVAAYTVFLVPSPSHRVGTLNPAGYHAYAAAGAVLMVAAILVSAIGTQRSIAITRADPTEARPVKAIFRDLLETLRNRAFATLLVAGLFAYASQGLTFAMSNYLYGFVWRFAPTTFFAVGIVLFAGVLIAFYMAPTLTKRLGKRRSASMMMVCATCVGLTPYALHLLGAMPVGRPWVIPVLFLCMMCSVACGVSALINGTSMMADVVEFSEETTGRRSEGVFFAGNLFVQKATSGLGIFIAGAVLWLAGFPPAATPGQVPVSTVNSLVITFALASLALSSAAAFAYSRFPLDRDDHARRLEVLRKSETK